jgi:hypothetical protein
MGCDSESHRLHICSLKLHGQQDRVKCLTDCPTVQCRQCGVKANSVEYICAAHLQQDAPNVEGGHGTVELDEIGKAHSG